MAQNQIKFGVGFNVDANSLKILKSQLQEILKLTVADLKLQGIDKSEDELNNLKKTISQVDSLLDSSFNKDLGTLNIAKFNQNLKNSGQTLGSLQAQFNSMGASGANAFRNLTAEILTTKSQVKETQVWLEKMGNTMANTIRWSISSSALNAFTSSIQGAYSYAKKLDESLNNIRIVTEKSADEMERFARTANKAAKGLGASTTSYTDAALIYYQQGLSDAEVQARTDVTLKVANVTGQSADVVSEQLTSVWNGYKVSSEEAEIYIDKLSAVAATTAADLEELSTGMSKVASAANAMGVDIDQLNAQLATIISVTRQAPESVGTALKTIYARMGDLQLGETDDGVALGDVSSQLEQVGIQILDTNGDLRDMGMVMEEVAAKWNTWNSAQQQAVAIAMAGKRQYNNLLALFENWDMYEESLQTSVNSVGTLQKQQDIYMESTEAHLQRLSTSLEGLSDSLLDSKTINIGANFLNGLTEGAERFVDAIGGGLGVLNAFGAILLRVFSQQLSGVIVNLVLNINKYIDNIRQARAETELMAQASGLEQNDARLTKLVQTRERQLQYTKAMSAEEQNFGKEIIQSTVNLYSQQDALQKNLNKIKEFLGFDVNLEVTANTDVFSKNIDEAIAKAEKNLERLGSKKDSLGNGTGLSEWQNDLQDATKRAMDANDVYLAEQNKYINSQVEQNSAAGFSPEVLAGLAQDDIQKYNGYLAEQTMLQKKQLEGVLSEEEEQRLKNLTENLLPQFEKSFVNAASNSASSLENLKSNVEELEQKLADDNNYDLFSPEDKQELQDAIKNYKELSVAGADQKQILEALTNVTKKYNNAINNSKKSNQQAKEALEKAKTEQEKINFALAEGEIAAKRFENSMKFKSLAQTAINTVSSIGMISSSLQSLKAIGDTWADTEASFGEKMLSTMTSIGFAAPMLLNSLGQIFSLFNRTNKAKEREVLINQLVAFSTKESTEQERLNAIAKWLTGDQIDENIKKKLIDAGITKKLTGDVSKATIVDALHTAGLKDKSISLILAGKSSKIAAGGMASLAAATWAALWPVLAIVAGLAAVAGVIALIVNDFNSYDNALAEATKATNNLAEAYNNVKAAYDSLKNDINNYKELSEGLDGIIEGTIEWKEALLDVNNQVIDLIQKYPELAAYVSKNQETGALEIDEAGLDMILDKQLEATYVAQRSLLAGQNAQIDAQSDVDAMTVSKQIGLSWWEPDEVYALTDALKEDAEAFKDTEALAKALEGTALDHITSNKAQLQGLIDNTDKIQELAHKLDVANKQQETNNSLIADSILTQEGGKSYSNSDYKDAISNTFQSYIDEDSVAYKAAQTAINNLSDDELKRQYANILGSGYKVEGDKIVNAKGEEVSEWNKEAAKTALTTERAMQSAQGAIPNVIEAVNKLVNLYPKNDKASEEEQKNIEEIRKALASFAGNNGEFVDLKNLTNKQVKILEKLDWTSLNDYLKELGYTDNNINVSDKTSDYKNTFENIFTNMALSIRAILPKYKDQNGNVNTFWNEFSLEEAQTLSKLFSDLLMAGLDIDTYTQLIQGQTDEAKARITELIAQQDWSSVSAEEIFNKLLKKEGIEIDPEIINNFVSQIEFLKGTISNFNLAEDQKRIAEINKIMSNLKLGDIIDADQYKLLGEEGQSYFSLMADGTYMLINDAERLNKILKENQKYKYLETIQEASFAKETLENTKANIYELDSTLVKNINRGFRLNDISTTFTADNGEIWNPQDDFIREITNYQKYFTYDDGKIYTGYENVNNTINKLLNGESVSKADINELLQKSLYEHQESKYQWAFSNKDRQDPDWFYKYYFGTDNSTNLIIDQKSAASFVKAFSNTNGKDYTKLLTEEELSKFNEIKKKIDNREEINREDAQWLINLGNRGDINSEALKETYLKELEKTEAEVKTQYANWLGEQGSFDELEFALKNNQISEEDYKNNIEKVTTRTITEEFNMSKEAFENYRGKLTNKDAINNLRSLNKQLNLQSQNVQDNQKLLDKLSDTQNYVWGQNLINNLAAQIEAQKELNKQTKYELDLTKQLAQIRLQAEAERYGFNFDIENTSMVDLLAYELTDDFKKKVVENNLTAAWDDFKKMVENDLTNIESLEETLIEGERNIISRELEKLDTTVQIHLDLGQAERDWREFQNTMARIADDDYLNKYMTSKFNFETYNQGLIETTNALNSLLAKPTLTAEEQEKVKEYQQTIMNNLSEQISLLDEMEQTYLDAVSNISEVTQQQMDEIETINGLYEHQLSLIELLGAAGLDYDKNMAYENIAANLEVQVKLAEEDLARLTDRRTQLEKDLASKSLSEEERRIYEKELDLINESLGKAAETYYSTLESQIENLSEWFNSQVQDSFDGLSKDLFGTDLEWASEEWDMINKRSDQYLDSVNRAYEIKKLENKYLDSIDNASSVTTQSKLNKLMNEELKYLREKDKLSKYEIDRANLIYDITLKQIALEEQQRNKSKMRLRRDASGNYSYQFVSDADEIAKVEQELMDLNNELYNLDVENYKDNLNEAVSAYEEYVEKVTKILNDNTLTKEEKEKRIKETTEIYQDIIDGYVSTSKTAYENIATDVSTIVKDQIFGDESKRVVNEFINDGKLAFGIFADAVDGANGFGARISAVINTFTGENGLLATFQTKLDPIVSKLNEAMKKPEDTILGKAASYLQDIADKTDDIQNAVDAATAVGADLKNLASILEEWKKIKDTAMQAAEAANKVYKSETGSKVENIDDLKKFNNFENTLNDIYSKYNNNEDWITLSNKDVHASQMKEENDMAAKEWAEIERIYTETWTAYNLAGDTKSAEALYQQFFKYLDLYANKRDNNIISKEKVIANEVDSLKQSIQSFAVVAGSLQGRDYAAYENGKNQLYQRWQALLNYAGDNNLMNMVDFESLRSKIAELKTGGYTGTWGSSGKLAMLHEKELILNKQDTENILSAVDMVRRIASFNSSFLDALEIFANERFNSDMMRDTDNNVLEQHVQIEAHFPNVSDKNEIEEAFNDLINLATQRVNRNIR